MDFGKRLKELLSEHDITQKQLAQELNIGVTTLGNYIRGIREPDFDTLSKIALYFDVSTDMLLGLPVSKNISSQEAMLHGEFIRLSARDRKLLLEIARCMSDQKK